MGSMSASDAAPLPRLGEVFFDVRGSTRSMRLSWYADTGIAVFSIWQGGTCTGTFRLPIDDLPRMMESLHRGMPGGPGNGQDGGATLALAGQRPRLALGASPEPFTGAMTALTEDAAASYQSPGYGADAGYGGGYDTSGGYGAGVAEPTYLSDYRNQQYGNAAGYEAQQYGDAQPYGDAQRYGQSYQEPGSYPDAQPAAPAYGDYSGAAGSAYDPAQAAPGYSSQDYSGQDYSGPSYNGQDYNGQSYDSPGYDAQAYGGQDYNGQGYDAPGYSGQGLNGQAAYNGAGYEPQGYDGQGYAAQGEQQYAGADFSGGSANQGYSMPDAGSHQLAEYVQPDPVASYQGADPLRAGTLSAPVPGAPASPRHAQDSSAYREQPGYGEPAGYPETRYQDANGYADAGYPPAGGFNGGYQAPGYAEAGAGSAGGGYSDAGASGSYPAGASFAGTGAYQANGYGDANPSGAYQAGGGYAAAPGYPSEGDANGHGYQPNGYANGSPSDATYNGNGYTGNSYADAPYYQGNASGSYPAAPQPAVSPTFTPTFTPSGGGYEPGGTGRNGSGGYERPGYAEYPEPGYPGGQSYGAEQPYVGGHEYGNEGYAAGYAEDQQAAYPSGPSFTPAGQPEPAQRGYWDGDGDSRDRQNGRDSREQRYSRRR
jgi:hypothetical protein